MGGLKLAQEERAYIESQIRAGVEYKAIARRVSRDQSTISKIARKIGIYKHALRPGETEKPAPAGLARFEEPPGAAGAVELPAPRPVLLPPPRSGPEIRAEDGRIKISVDVAPEAILDLLIAKCGTTPHEVIKWALAYMRDEDGKIAPPDVVRLIAEITGAPI